MYCGSCLHDNTLAAALQRLGHEVALIPTYTPVRTDEHDVSIETLRQEGHGDDATLEIVTHEASEQALAETCETLRGLDSVRQITSTMRVVGQ